MTINIGNMYVHGVNKHTLKAGKQTNNHKTDMISVGWNLWMCRHLLVEMWHNLPSMHIKTYVSLGGVASKQHFTGLLLTQCKSLLVRCITLEDPPPRSAAARAEVLSSYSALRCCAAEQFGVVLLPPAGEIVVLILFAVHDHLRAVVVLYILCTHQMF